MADTDFWGDHVLELISLLAASAPQLRHLEYQNPLNQLIPASSALPADIGRLSQLTSLQVHTGSASVSTAQVAAMLKGLPSLQRLHLQSTCTPLRIDRLLWNIDRLLCEIADCCPQLKDLHISGAEFGDIPSELGRLRGLTRLALPSNGISSLPESISLLTAMQELDLIGNNCSSLPEGLSACWQLTRLALDEGMESPVNECLQSLRYLHVYGWKDRQQGQAPYWAHLTGLSGLCLSSYGPNLPQFLLEVAGLESLRSLDIRDAQLSKIPEGPYLSRLETLCLSACTCLSGVPENLAAAWQLRALDLVGLNIGIALTPSDVDLLSNLPALKNLRLFKSNQVARKVWDKRVATLKAKFAARADGAPPKITIFKFPTSIQSVSV